MKNGKRILSVTIRRMLDDSPDTSWLGKYANRPTSEYSIDRAHSLDCASQTYNPQTIEAKRILEHVQQTIGDLQNSLSENKAGKLEDAYNEIGELLDTIAECDCDESGDIGRTVSLYCNNECRYFNPSFNYVDILSRALPENTPEEVRKYVRQDYDRMKKINSGYICFIGLQAVATYFVGHSGMQFVTSSGHWGIESDSRKDYIESVEKEELADLRTKLQAVGFSTRAISAAFKNIERKED